MHSKTGRAYLYCYCVVFLLVTQKVHTRMQDYEHENFLH